MKYNVEIIKDDTGEVVSVIGEDMTLKQAERREETGLSRIDTNNYSINIRELTK